MNASLCYPKAGETDPELLGIGATVSTVATAVAWVGVGLPLPRCAFHAITGCPCPTCGATRCVLSLMHGDVGGALAWNPLVFAGIVGVALFNLYAIIAMVFGLPRVRVRFGTMEWRILRVACVVLVLANWAYLIHHGV